MILSQDTQRIVEQVEEATGLPIHVLTDPDLPTLATFALAKGAMPTHRLAYRPGFQGTDYAIACQCGFILRLYANPAESRFEFAAQDEGRKSVYRSLAPPNGTLTQYNLPASAVKIMTDQLFDGLMTQLRSMPIAMRVDAWLRKDYPSLRGEQEQSFAVQQSVAAQGLSPQIRQMSPPTIFSANAAMNAAFALFCDRLLGRSLYTIPYRSMGLVERGQTLLDVFDQLPQDATSDRALVDAWGEELGLTDWYTWIPLRK